MSEVKQSVLAAAGVVACATAVLIGTAVRGKNDLGGAGDGLPAYSGRLASAGSNTEVPAVDYFYELSEKLKKEYVEPIQDDQKLASGAVRGMIASLSDPKSTYMGKDEFQAFLNARQGQYEGIGADLALVIETVEKPQTKAPAGDRESNEATAEEALALGYKIPRVKVVSVVPGGPSAKAGVKPGDYVYSVDGHWVANTGEVAEFRKTQKAFLEKKITRDEYNAVYKTLRKKMDRALMPTKVIEKLIVGKTGAIKLEWQRGGTRRTTEIDKAVVVAPGFAMEGDTVRLPFAEGSAERLKTAIQGRTAVSIDLRNNANGDPNVMRECLALLAPTGKYGTLTTDKKEKPALLTVAKGSEHPPQLTLLVDQTTSGAAEIFALALSTHAHAKLSGSPMGGDRSIRQIVQLPDGTGYTLVTSVYKPQIELNTIVAQGGAR